MTNLAELRGGQGSQAVPAAVWSALLPIGAVAYIAWKVLEGENDTIYNSQFDSWLTTVGVAAACVALVGSWFWRTTPTRLAFAAGLLLAGLACYVGTILDTLLAVGFGS